jgi:ankyrin repeat protein
MNYFNIYLFFIIKLAARYGHTATCQFLTDKGSDLNVKNNYGEIPLHLGEY